HPGRPRARQARADGVKVRPVTPRRLVDELVGRIAATAPDGWLRVGVDGAPGAEPDRLADALVAPLRVLGRPVVRVDSGGFLLPGPLLLGTGLDLDLTVHCAQSPAALARRLPDGYRWTLPAYARYAEEVGPEYLADVVVRVDDPRHPALVEPAG